MPKQSSRIPVNDGRTLFDPETGEPPLTARGELASVVGPRIADAIPRTLMELREREGLSRLQVDAIEDREDQVTIGWLLARQLERSPAVSTLLQKPTGTGKTYDAFIFAAKALDMDRRVIFLTTRNLLVSQAAGDMFRILEIDSREVSLHSEGRLSREQRATNYLDSERRIIIATDDTFRRDLDAGLVELSDFVFIIDETHNREYLPLLEKIRDAGVPALGISATLADDPRSFEELCTAFGVEAPRDVLNAHIDTGAKEYQNLVFELDPRVYDAGIEILSLLKKGTSDLLLPSVKFGKVLRTPGEALGYAIRDAFYNRYISHLRTMTRENIKDVLGEVLGVSLAGRIAVEIAGEEFSAFSPKLRKKLVDRIGEECTLALEERASNRSVLAFGDEIATILTHRISLEEADKIRGRVLRVEQLFAEWETNLGRERRLPFQTLVGTVRFLALEIEGLLRKKNGDSGDAITAEQKYILSKTIELQELCRYHEVLTSMGLQAFLHEYSSKFLDFYMRKTHGRGVVKNPKKDGPEVYGFENRLYLAHDAQNETARHLYRTFKNLAGGDGEGATPYRDTFKQAQAIRDFRGGMEMNVQDFAKNIRVFLADSLATTAQNRALRTPKEFALVDGINEILAESPGAKILVYAEYEHLVTQLALTIEGLSRDTAGPAPRVRAGYIFGDMTKTERERQLSALERGEVSVLVMTSVGLEGLHIAKADWMFICSHLSKPSSNTQLAGRVGHGGTHSTVFRLLNLHSPDITRVERARQRKHASMEATRRTTHLHFE